MIVLVRSGVGDTDRTGKGGCMRHAYPAAKFRLGSGVLGACSRIYNIDFE